MMQKLSDIFSLIQIFTKVIVAVRKYSIGVKTLALHLIQANLLHDFQCSSPITVMSDFDHQVTMFPDMPQTQPQNTK